MYPGRMHDADVLIAQFVRVFTYCIVTCCSMNRLEDAEKRFSAALRLMTASEADNKPSHDDIGGILVGLGLVKDRLGDAEGAVSVLQSAVTHYRQTYGEDGSTLIAKALTSLGRCKETLNKLDEAGEHFEEVLTLSFVNVVVVAHL